MARQQNIDYTIPLLKDRSSRLLGVIIGFMVYIATLAAIAAIMLLNLSDAWSHSLSGRVTVIIPSISDNGIVAPPERLAELVSNLNADKGIATVEVVRDEQLADLVRPWFGEDSNVAVKNLPIPQLLSLRLGRDSPPSTDELIEIVRRTHPEARVNTHQLWRGRIVSLTGALGWLAGSVLLIIAFFSAVLVAYATRTTLGSHETVIGVLDILGAPDKYVVDRFRAWAQRASLQGAFFGLALAAITYFVIAWRTSYGEAEILNEARPHWIQLILLLLPALMTSLIAQTTTSMTVRRMLLQRDEE